MDKILLKREQGVFQISGNNITIIPQENVMEAWSKKNNADSWGRLLEAQQIPLEKVTYRFTKDYVSDRQEWNLILQTENVTKREGPVMTSNTRFENAYYYNQISPSHPLLELPVKAATPGKAK